MPLRRQGKNHVLVDRSTGQRLARGKKADVLHVAHALQVKLQGGKK